MIVYLKYNQNRKDKFQLWTLIEYDNGKYYVYKKSQNEMGTKFLLSLKDKYKLLRKQSMMIKPLEILKINKNYAKYEYLKDPTLLNFISKAIIYNENNEFEKIIYQYVDLIRSLKTKRVNLTKDFYSIFGSGVKKEIKFNCLSFGCIDLIFDNIVKISDTKFIYYDYEWTFAFPIPTDYIIFRGLINLYYYFKNYDIHLHFKSLKKILLELDIYKNINQFICYEYEFNKYVHKDFSNNISFEEYKKNILFLINNKESYNRSLSVDLVERSLNYDYFVSENIRLKEKVKELEETNSEFINFKNGALWKNLIKYRNLKHKLLKK